MFAFILLFACFAIGVIALAYTDMHREAKKTEKQKTESRNQARYITASTLAYRTMSPVSTSPVDVSLRNIDDSRHSFIALDVETTGLHPEKDRIIEIGAALFEDGKLVRSFSSLVNAGVQNPAAAYKVNHISNSQLKYAPLEADIYPRFLDFLGDAVNGKIVMCAHNAKFDFDFLNNTLRRLGYSANIRYVDTLYLARRCIPGLPNYKQCTLEEHFGLTNDSSHRAGSDAENCGRIFCFLLEQIPVLLEDELRWHEWQTLSRPYWEEGEVARINGQLMTAIELFDKAKEAGFIPQTVYESYAKAYRKLNDYSSELKILDEGIEKLGHEHSDILIERREKVLVRIAAKEKAQQIAAEKELLRAQKAAKKLQQQQEELEKPKNNPCRPVMQLSDTGEIIKTFPSVAAASRELNVNPKSIREAAKGRQKHAAGYCWQYTSEAE